MALDLNALAAQDTEVPVRTRANKVAESPFPGWIKETYESGKAKMIPVPAAQVGELRYAIRTAAGIQGLGSRIVLQDKNGGPLEWVSESGEAFVARESAEGLREVPQNTTVHVIFKGQDKRQRRTKEEIEAARAGGEDSEDSEGTENPE